MARYAALLCVALALLGAGAGRCANLKHDEDEDFAPIDAGQKQKLRHGRFEKLDGLFLKLSRLNAGADSLAPTTARPPEPDESAEAEEGLGSLEDEYEEEEDYDELDEVHSLDGLSSEQQLEELFGKILQSDQWVDSDLAGDDADDDWQDFNGEYQSSQPESSTRRRHDESSNFLRFDRNSPTSVAALKHYRQMTTVGKCSVPQPRVVSVQSLYPHTSKIYFPHCTMLHQCSDETGCCMHDSLTCAPKKTKQIDLFFVVKSLDRVHGKVEKLTFYNHTECGCIARQANSMVKDERNHLPHYRQTGIYHSSETETESPLTLRRCKCPNEFSVHILENGQCRCNCFNKQRDCLRLKRGKEYLGLRDRLCIQNHECEQPNCEFGTYILKAGRCPRKHEQVERRLHYSGRIF